MPSAHSRAARSADSLSSQCLVRCRSCLPAYTAAVQPHIVRYVSMVKGCSRVLAGTVPPELDIAWLAHPLSDQCFQLRRLCARIACRARSKAPSSCQIKPLTLDGDCSTVVEEFDRRLLGFAVQGSSLPRHLYLPTTVWKELSGATMDTVAVEGVHADSL